MSFHIVHNSDRNLHYLHQFGQINPGDKHFLSPGMLLTRFPFYYLRTGFSLGFKERFKTYIHLEICSWPLV